jgi:hypothetical protein
MAKQRVCAENQKGVYGKRKKAASKSALTVGGDGSAIDPPPEVVGDPVALSKWKWISDSHKKMGYVPADGDIEAMARLCVVYSGMERIQKRIESETDGAVFAALNRLVDSKCRIAVQLEDRLLLNPTSRMRGIPKETKKEVPENIKDIVGRL